MTGDFIANSFPNEPIDQFKQAEPSENQAFCGEQAMRNAGHACCRSAYNAASRRALICVTDGGFCLARGGGRV
jgi:hypothetical protein